ncbi:MAG TPA: BatA domain-containing protein, partial [Blastocatellia bacterium]|nr:BatA domain-containing protein [Blastocatellia bacterium]
MSFLNPLFLLGLAAVALPVIVHLVRRTRAKKIEFASLMFVRQIPQRTIRRKQLHNILLLILRSLAFLLLVLAFARPYFKNSALAEASGRGRASIILLDSSFSTRYQNRFDQIKSRAKAIAGEASTDDKVAVVAFGQSSEIQSRFTNDKAKIQAVIDSAQPGMTATNYVQALQSAEELMKEAGISSERRIVLISDFQAGGWNPGDTSFKLSKDNKLITIDVSDGNTANLAITDVSAQPVIYQQKYTDKLGARIHNFGDDEKAGVQVEFLLNDHTVEKREIKVPAHESVSVEFTEFNLSEGANRALITIKGDDFALDNNFYVTLRRDPQGQALVIENAGRGESLFLRSAL